MLGKTKYKKNASYTIDDSMVLDGGAESYLNEKYCLYRKGMLCGLKDCKFFNKNCMYFKCELYKPMPGKSRKPKVKQNDTSKDKQTKEPIMQNKEHETQITNKNMQNKEHEMQVTTKNMQNSQKINDEQKKQKNQVPEIEKRYGTEEVIDSKHFKLHSNIMSNIVMKVIENKLNFAELLKEVENMIVEDNRTNSKHEPIYPQIKNSMIALSLMAEKLNCSVSELMEDNEEKRKELAYSILKQIKFAHFEPEYYDEDTIEFNLTMDDLSLWLDMPVPSRHQMLFISSFDEILELNKEVDACKITFSKSFEDDGIYYILWFGDNSLCANRNKTKPREFFFRGGLLWVEETGELEQFIEEVLASNPEWAED